MLSVPKEVVDNHIESAMDEITLMIWRHTFLKKPLTRRMILGKEHLIVRNGISVIEYFRSLQYISDETVTCCTASNGQSEVLEYCLANNYQWHPATINLAARSNSLPCLLLAIRAGCVTTDLTKREALLNGSIECLNYLLKQRLIALLPGDIHCAIKGGYQCFEMVASTLPNRLRDIRVDLFMTDDPMILTLAETLGYNVRGIANAAARNGNLPILKWVQKHYPIDLNDGAFNAACGSCSLDCIKYLHELGLSGTNVFNKALRRGNVECVKYLSSVGYRYDLESHCCVNNVECLKFLDEIGCFFSSETMEHVITTCEDLEMLKYLHRRKVQWPMLDMDIFRLYTGCCLTKDQIDCVIYALKHGCPYDILLMEWLLEIPGFNRRLSNQ